jgi:TatD DNase family protein
MYNYIVDTHCHLDLIEEKGINIEEILENCEEKNVKILQTICTKISSVEKILKYTENNQNIYSSVGLHPCNVSVEEFRTASEILAICEKNSKIIGIGETGLDYYHDLSQVELQKKSFLEHIEASVKSDLPLIIHSRNADDDMMEILKNTQKNHKFPALLHCFSSSPALARCALDLGIYISIAGIITFKNAEELQKIVKEIPLEFLLIETDSPYLAPMPHRGKINQPAYTFYVAEFIAKLKNLEVEKVIEQTTKNFHKIFKRAKIIN